MAAGFKTATVNAASVPSTQTNFPAYVDLSRIGITTLAEAQSVRVYADSGKTTEWAREIVSESEMHVKIPSLTSTTDIYVDWDGVRGDYAVTDTYGRNAVWSDYIAVLHLQEDPTGGAPQFTDSSGNSNDGTAQGTPASGTSIDAVLGKGFDGDGVNDYISLPSTDFVGISSYTVSAWVKRTDASSDNSWFGGIYQTAGLYRKLYFGVPGTTSNTVFYARLNAATSYQLTPTTAHTKNTWQHMVWQDTGAGSRKWYLNASVEASDTQDGVAPIDRSSEDTVSIGAVHYNGALNFIANQPQIDEFRLTALVRTDSWVTTEYNNQSAESTFWGTWTDAGGGTTFTPKVMMF